MSLLHNPNFLQPSRKRPLDNILGKGENAGNQHFLLFSKCFLPFLKQNSNFESNLFFVVCKYFNLDHSKILSFGKKLMCPQ